MAHLIDKSALVAEIEKRFDEYSNSILKHYDACKEARAQELGKILIILNTLEVKEVPIWEKVSPDTGQTILYKDGGNSYLERFGYRIDLKDLDKLPKKNLKAQKGKDMTEIKAGNCYMCLKDIEGYDSFTKGKVYASLYDNALINDNHIEVKVKNGECFRIATENEIRTQKVE